MKSKAALLWDESFLWGLMAYRALKANKLSFEIISANDIKNGKLKNYEMLFVPGGWASNKVRALEDKGISEIKKFVNKGGNYLGFCGGAGLATLDGIGLLNIKRKPTKERVPSFSGRIHLNINDHPIWNSSLLHSITPSTVFHAWWPSQFLISDKNIKILATYGDPLPDSFSSDLNVGDIEVNGNWQELENLYQINLDPKRLLNEPAVVEGTFGKGRVILSLIHFDTPEDENGARVLKNLWEYLTGSKEQKSGRAEDLKKKTSELLSDLATAVEELISLGIRNFLWFRRNPMLLQWRRGVRGLEYCTLYVMIKELKKLRMKEEDLHAVEPLLADFVDKAKKLLIMERIAMQNGHITPLSPPLVKGGIAGGYDQEIQKIRTELFGNSKSHGGLFKNLIDEIDALLFGLIIK